MRLTILAREPDPEPPVAPAPPPPAEGQSKGWSITYGRGISPLPVVDVIPQAPNAIMLCFGNVSAGHCITGRLDRGGKRIALCVAPGYLGVAFRLGGDDFAPEWALQADLAMLPGSATTIPYWVTIAVINWQAKEVTV